jgi:hypothetical protein
MPYAPLPPINNVRISSSRLSLPSEKARAANEIKRSEVHNRFGGYLQQFAFGSSSPASPSIPTSDNNNSPFPSDAPDVQDLTVDSTMKTASNFTAYTHLSNSHYYNSTSSSSHISSESHPSSDSNFSDAINSNPTDDLNDSNYVADSQEPKQNQTNQNQNQNPPTQKKLKKFLCKLDDEDNLSFPDYSAETLNFHYFKQRNNTGSPMPDPPATKPTPSIPPAKETTNTPSLPSTIKRTPSFTLSTEDLLTKPADLTPNTSNKSQLKQTDKTPNNSFKHNNNTNLNRSFDKSANAHSVASTDNSDIIGDSPNQPVPSKRALFGDLTIGDSDGSGDERKRRVGTKRK